MLCLYALDSRKQNNVSTLEMHACTLKFKLMLSQSVINEKIKYNVFFYSHFNFIYIKHSTQ